MTLIMSFLLAKHVRTVSPPMLKSHSHKVSTPHYPQSNGKVEATVKSMKRIIRISWNGRSLNQDKFCRALLQYRNTPSRKDSLSPAQKLYGRPVQDIIPAHHRSFSEEWQEWQHKPEAAEQQAQQTLKSSEEYYNQHAHPLQEIQIGSNVAIHNNRTKLWDIYGIVTYISPHRRYHVKTLSGRVLVRNRHFLRRRVPASIPVSTQQQLTSHITPTPEPPSTRRSTRCTHPPSRLITGTDHSYCTNFSIYTFSICD